MNEIQGCVIPSSVRTTQMARSKVSLCHWRHTIADSRVRSRQALYMEMSIRRMLLPLYPWRRISKNLLNKRFNKTRCQSEHTGEDKYPLPSMGFKSCSYTSLLTYLLHGTELS